MSNQFLFSKVMLSSKNVANIYRTSCKILVSILKIIGCAPKKGDYFAEAKTLAQTLKIELNESFSVQSRCGHMESET